MNEWILEKLEGSIEKQVLQGQNPKSEPIIKKPTGYANPEALKPVAKVRERKEEKETWFPHTQCPHGYQNSFKCREAGGGCKQQLEE